MNRTLRELEFEGLHKSFPAPMSGMSPSDVEAVGWHLHRDFATPVAVLKESALAHNLDRMCRYCAEHGVQIAPHGKTTMSPELIRRQLDHGAWGITAATAWQARTFLDFGARRVIIANECIDPVGLTWIAEHRRDHPDVEVYCFADSPEALNAMQDVLKAVPNTTPLPVLVEIGVRGGRAGTRDLKTAVELGRAASSMSELELAGVAGFEGVIGASRDHTTLRHVRDFLALLRRTSDELMSAGAFRPDRPVILSAGGSAFFDHVVDVLAANRDDYPLPVEVIIRSGCYLTHDHTTYHELSPFLGSADDFRPALELWSRVLSTPEPGLAILDAGKRDISTDAQMPIILGRMRAGEYVNFQAADSAIVVDHFNDQHGYVHIPDRTDILRVGDIVRLGISHPCTTFDKWRLVPVVDDDYNVTSAVQTFF